MSCYWALLCLYGTIPSLVRIFGTCICWGPRCLSCPRRLQAALIISILYIWCDERVDSFLCCSVLEDGDLERLGLVLGHRKKLLHRVSLTRSASLPLCVDYFG